MEDRHREILRKSRTLFVRDLQSIPDVCDVLLEFSILTYGMKDEILAQSTREGKVRKLLDTVVRRGSRAFDYFHQALVDTHQQFLADILKPEFAAQNHPAYNDVLKDKRSMLARSNTVDPGQVELKRQRSEENEKNLSASQHQTANISNVLPSGGRSVHNATECSAHNMFNNMDWNNISLSATFPASRQRGLRSESSLEEVKSKDDMGVTNLISSIITQPQEEDDQLPQVWPSLDDHARPAHVDVRQFQVTDLHSLPLLQGLDHYQMAVNPRGRVVVINNAVFSTETGLSQRHTADMDGTSLDLLFKQLNFRRKVYRNLNQSKILEVLDKERQMDHTDHQCFVLVVMSHGSGRTVYGSDGGEVDLESIIDKFSNSNCPTLAGKPKLFFIQACQKVNICEEKSSSIDSSLSSDFDSLGKELDELVCSINSSCTQSDLCMDDKADMFVARATTSESLRWNSEEKGSKFIQAIVYVFKKLAYKEDLVSLMTKVNELLLSGDYSADCPIIHMEFSSSLQKKLYFFPGFPPH